MKRCGSYIAAVCDIVDQFCFHVAGAIGLGSVIPDMARILIEREGKSAEQIKNDIRLRYELKNLFQQLVHSLNHESRGNQSAFTNISVYSKRILESLIGDRPQIIEAAVELQKIFLSFFDKGNPLGGGAPYTFPIVTVNSINPVECDLCQWIVENCDIVRYNFFFSETPKIATCCRLVSNSDMMKNYARQGNSFSSGFGDIGSHRVITINIPRIALEHKTLAGFEATLRQRVKDCVVMLKAHKNSLLSLVEDGVYPSITDGWININRLFSTVGLIGFPEAERIFNLKGRVFADFSAFVIDIINYEIEHLAEEFELAINVEQIPGESASIKLARADRSIFGEDMQPFEYYSNQFIPLWKDALILDKLEGEGKNLNKLTGGGITLARIVGKVDDPRVKMTYLKMAWDRGAHHIAFTTTFSLCIDNHCSTRQCYQLPVCCGMSSLALFSADRPGLENGFANQLVNHGCFAHTRRTKQAVGQTRLEKSFNIL